MKDELIRPIVRVGNSAGIILPIAWLHGKAKVSLIDEPVDIKKEVIGILDEYLPEVLGIYLAGSYARGEQTAESDIDIIAVTEKTNKRIKRGKFDILLISSSELKNALKEAAFPLLPMVMEAKPILNNALIKEFLKDINLRKIYKILDLTCSSLGIIGNFIGKAKEDRSSLGEGISYSLVLNLRTVYLLECIRNGRKWSTAELKRIIQKVSGSLSAYNAYIDYKEGSDTPHVLPLREAESLYEYLQTKLNTLKDEQKK